MKLIKLSKKRTVAVSEIFRDVAQIFFASSVVSPLLLGAEKSDEIVLISGLLLSTGLWMISVIMIKE